MISFEHVEKSDVKYEILYPYIRVAHNFFFYRHYYVLNEENIPKDKPLVVICNHQNGLSDALGILFAFHKDGRRPVFIARADIFKKDFIAKLLRFLRIMPAYRAVDVGREKVGQNTEIFAKAGKIVGNNGVISLFPEAGHEDCHHLGTFKGGFARIAFAAAEEFNFEKPVYILPCSNHYSDYFGFHHKLIITIGKPFSFEDLYDVYKEYPEKARKMLAQRSREHVKPLMLDIEDKSLYEEYDLLRTIYAPILLDMNKQKVSYYPNILKAEQQVVTSIDRLKVDQDYKYQELMDEAKLYSKYLDKLQIFDWVLAEKVTFGNFLLRLLYAVLLIPVILIGFVVNFIPYNASTLVTRKIKDPMLHNSFHFGMGALVSFPLWYIILFIVGLFLFNWWVAVIGLVVYPVSFLIYLRSKIIVKKQLLRFRRFGMWWRGDTLYRKAKELREQIITNLNHII